VTRILAINTGSSSVKLALFGSETEELGRKRLGSGEEPRSALTGFMAGKAPDAIVHRVVHGGRRATPAPVDTALITELEQLIPLAPNHNPRAIEWLRASREAWPDVPAFAVFDTAFFANLPAAAATYALPRELARDHGLRRYGFHGLAHESMWRTYQKLGRPAASRVVTLQLGSGCSAAAIQSGCPLDTSMGFTPLEGLVMATRAGDVDPGLILWLLRERGVEPKELERMLAEKSGLLGLGGERGDLGALLESRHDDALLAVDVFVWRLRKYLGAYLAVLQGAEAILFGGGIGEHLPEIRRRALTGFEWAGVVLDDEANQRAIGKTARLHAESSRVEIWTVAVDEETLLAETCRRLLQADSGDVLRYGVRAKQ
jgi:acetate kinase